MKKHRSVVSVLATILLFLNLFASVPVLSFAAESAPTFEVQKVAADSGEKSVAVDVYVKNNPGVSSVSLDIHFDKNALTLTGFTYNVDALNGADTVPFNAQADIPCLSMVNGTANVTGDFKLATLYFNVAENANGNYEISLTYDENNVYNIREQNIAFQTVKGGIAVNGTEQPEIPDAPAFVVQSTKAKKGAKDVKVSVSVKNNPGIASAALDILFDDKALTLTGFTYNSEALNGSSTVPFNPSAKPYCLSIVNSSTNINGDILLATLSFTIADTALGSYDISLNYDPNNVYNIEENNVAFQIVKGNITVLASGSDDPDAETTDISNWTVKGLRNKTYTGKPVTQSFTVIDEKGKQATFDVDYKNNINAGTAKAIIKGTGKYTGTITKTFKIAKAANPLKLTKAKKTYRQARLTKKTIFKIKVKKARGKLRFTLNKKAKKAKIKVSSKGKVTIPKKCKKGTYKITVKAAGNKNYKAAKKTVTIKVR